MIEHIVKNGNGSEEELAAVILVVSKKHSSNYENYQIDNNKSLRVRLQRSIMKECYELIPDVTKEQWAVAALTLAGRG